MLFYAQIELDPLLELAEGPELFSITIVSNIEARDKYVFL